MGWSCTRHEWDTGSDGWREATRRILERLDERHMARAETICPACYDQARTLETVACTMVRVMKRIIDGDQDEHDRERANELHAILEGECRGPVSTALEVVRRDGHRDLEPLRRQIVQNLKHAGPDDVAARWAERLVTSHCAALGLARLDPAAQSIRWAIAARIERGTSASGPVAYPPVGETVEAIWNIVDEGCDTHEAVSWAFAIARERGSVAGVLEALAEATGSWRDAREPMREVFVCLDVTDDHRLVARIEGEAVGRDEALAEALRAVARGDLEAVEATRDALCDRHLVGPVDRAALALAGTVRWDGEHYYQTGTVVVDEDGHGIDERLRHRLGPERQPVERVVEQARHVVLAQVGRWLAGDQDGAGALVAAMRESDTARGLRARARAAQEPSDESRRKPE